MAERLISVVEYQDGDFGNKITLVGNLGKDAEMSYTPNGNPVTKFSIAVWQGKDKDAMWLNCVCWQELAEHANRLLKRGRQVKVIGFLSSRKWKDKEGKDRISFEVTASSIQIIVRPSVTVVEEEEIVTDVHPVDETVPF